MIQALFAAGYVALILGIIAIGLFIGYQAYRGFRRHESGPMRYLSVGLILLTAVAPVIAFANWQAWRMGLVGESVFWIVNMLYRILQFVGLSLIAYSLYKRP